MQTPLPSKPDVVPGERVVLVHPNGTRVTVVVEGPGGGRGAGYVTGDLVGALCGHGWRVEHDKPAVTLPTEPGPYFDRGRSLWRLDNHRRWWMGDTRFGESPDDIAALKSYAPFTRLAPVVETAAEVIDCAETLQRGGYWESESLVAALRERFGVVGGTQKED